MTGFNVQKCKVDITALLDDGCAVHVIFSPHVWESGYQNLGNFYLWNPESWALESGIQSCWNPGIPLTIGIPNPSPTENDFESSSWNSESIHAVESRIQDCLRFPYIGRIFA